MSLHPRYVPDIPEETVRIAKVVFRKGNLQWGQSLVGQQNHPQRLRTFASFD